MKRFFDTNILVYAFSNDARQTLARLAMADGGVISAQVLNEFINVLRKKFKLDWPAVETAVAEVNSQFTPIQPLTANHTAAALALAAKDGLNIYDALIVASAQEAGCDELVTEDLQHGRVFGGLMVRNPFVGV